jgi:hypothetical protein
MNKLVKILTLIVTLLFVTFPAHAQQTDLQIVAECADAFFTIQFIDDNGKLVIPDSNSVHVWVTDDATRSYLQSPALLADEPVPPNPNAFAITYQAIGSVNRIINDLNQFEHHSLSVVWTFHTGGGNPIQGTATYEFLVENFHGLYCGATPGPSPVPTFTPG